MSYYSDVAIGLSLESYRILWEREKEFFDNDGSLLDLMTEFITRKDGTVVLIWEYIEWEGKLADRIEDFLDELDEEGTRSYSFVRLGEDINDIDTYTVIGISEPQLVGIGIKRELDIDCVAGDCHWYDADFEDLKF